MIVNTRFGISLLHFFWARVHLTLTKVETGGMQGDLLLVAEPRDCLCSREQTASEVSKRRPEGGDQKGVNGSRFKILRTEAICLIPKTHPNES